MTDRLTIDAAARMFGVHRQTVAKRIGDLPDDAKGKDRRGRWLLDPDALAEATGWSRAQPPLDPDEPAGSTGGLVSLEAFAPLLERIGNAERERADAQRDARIAEHRRQALEEAAAKARRRLVLAAAAAALLGLVLGAAVALALA